MLAVLAAIMATGCGGTHSELTLHQEVEKLSGRSLSSAEVDRQVALADLMCGFDRKVLEEIWMRLSPQQLEMQDLLFPLRCSDRMDLLVEVRPRTGSVETTTTVSRPASSTTTSRPIGPTTTTRFRAPALG